jgi:antitoxin component YwqK of YwqJK toxin-antitoxin module
MRSGILLVLIWLSAYPPVPSKRVEEFWPNGRLRRAFDLRVGVRDGEYKTFTIDGKPYELKHFSRGHEDGLQQAWDDRGELYLNYVVKNGRRYGMINAKPCLPAAADGTTSR